MANKKTSKPMSDKERRAATQKAIDKSLTSTQHVGKKTAKK